MGNHTDECGAYARYLYCAADAPLSKIDFSTDDGDIGLTKDLIALVQRLEELPERVYLLSDGAKVAFQRYQNELTERAEATDYPALETAYPKFETYFGRFIIWLHLVNAVLAGEEPAPVVDAYHVEIARHWTDYFIGQLKLILAVGSPQQELTGDLLRVYNYFEKKKRPLTARDVQMGKLFDRSEQKHKRQSNYIKGLLATLVEQRWLIQVDKAYQLVTVPENEHIVE